MEIIFRMLLLFVFIQFVVVMAIVGTALILARPDGLLLHDGEQGNLIRGLVYVIHLPSRALRIVSHWFRSRYNAP